MLQSSLFEDEEETVVHLHSGFTERTPINGEKVTERVFLCGERGPEQGEYAMLRSDGIYYQEPENAPQGTIYATEDVLKREEHRRICTECMRRKVSG